MYVHIIMRAEKTLRTAPLSLVNLRPSSLFIGISVTRAIGCLNTDVCQDHPDFWVMRMMGYPQLLHGGLGVSCGEHRFALPTLLTFWKMRDAD